MSRVEKYQDQVIEDSRQPEESSTVQVKNASAIKSTNGQNYPNPTEEGANFLRSFLNATPFFDLFEYIADHTYNSKSATAKLGKLKSVHPYFHTFCIIADIAVRCVVVIILIVLASIAAGKILL